MTAAVLAPAVERATRWRLLSLGLAPPSEDTLTEVEALAEVLDDYGDALARDVMDAVRGESVDAVGAAYQRLFGGRVLVSPYEGSYELDPVRQARQMADVGAFYRAFDACAHGPAAERPDHAGCELEFLAYLELRALAAAEEDADERLVDEIAEAFIRDHAGRWLPTFFAQLHAAAERDPYFRALAALGARAIAAEVARRELDPDPLPRRHPRSSVEADTFACGPG